MMRTDQLDQLKVLKERLIDVVIVEADPDNWPGQGKLPRALTKEERGDGVWCRRLAAATLALVTQIDRLVVGPEQPPPEFDDLDETIRRAEEEATQALRRLGVHSLGKRA